MKSWESFDTASADRSVDQSDQEIGESFEEEIIREAWDAVEGRGERATRGRKKGGKNKEKRGSEEKKPVDNVRVQDFPENLDKLGQPPEPFIEPDEKPYTVDATNALLPDPGFLSDFANLGRGMEAPTVFYILAGLWAISSALTRETWIRWSHKPLWPNIYALLVSLPGLCKKSTVIDLACDLIRALPERMPDTIRRVTKTIDVITGKTTPEGLLSFMTEKQTTLIDERDPAHPILLQVDHGSQASIAVGEFATFLGKQKYNEGMVPLLTALYDCSDANSEISKGEGVKRLTNIYTNLLGGITPDGLRLSIPEEAMGGGLMSRVLVAYVEEPARLCPVPIKIEGYPEVNELYGKFAWIIYNALGEYTISPEALEYYSKWYMAWKPKLMKSGLERQDTFRMDSIMVRIAALMRMQEYTPGRVIELKHFVWARTLLDWVYSKSLNATSDIGRTPEEMMRTAVLRVLERRQQMTRKQLMIYMSPRKCTATILNGILTELLAESRVKVMKDGLEYANITNDGQQVYIFIPADAEEDDDPKREEITF